MTPQKNVTVPLEQWINDIAERAQLTDYMLKESHLPGPRANLELSDSFTKCCGKLDLTDTAWELLHFWVNSSEEEVDTNDPRVFLTFCAVRASGAYYGYAEEERQSVIRGILKSAMNDSRWRMREAAAMGMQSIGEYDFTLLCQLWDRWGPGATQLEQRAFVAALAHPPLLKVQDNALYCLNLATEMMDRLAANAGVKGDPEHFRVLSKGLEYSLSVFVASEPVAGFAMLRKFAQSRDARVIKIVKSNLGKARLSKKYGPQVAEILNVMSLL
ncbi:hypothetical protein [Paenibacillus wynnii]|uniref:hypothetical protein n=1 Tax=Paenibacillus wynnii TaxID=268407 RepID=UPI00278E6372|nr:hypothetical protein [Paenibacillus wynnii]MDQ0193035.1 hypothetical protein [Paenibacillus wynnii]